jgi:hypothetical protein
MRDANGSTKNSRRVIVKLPWYFNKLRGVPRVRREALAGSKKRPGGPLSLSVFSATPRRKLHFGLFKMPLRRCLPEPVG